MLKRALEYPRVACDLEFIIYDFKFMAWQLIAHKTYDLEAIVHGLQPMIYNLQLIT